VEQARIGDWVVGTGGANLQKSAGHGRIIYAMRVTDKMTLHEYFMCAEFACKQFRPRGNHKYGDNIEPRSEFDKHERFVLISEHFYYFGRNAISIPKKRFPHLEKKGRWFRSDFDDTFIASFVKWIETEIGEQPGKHGEPCLRAPQLMNENCPPRKRPDQDYLPCQST
jgi:hypothetical protein